jgi:acetyl esterase/lipase
MAYNATKWVAEYGNVEVDGKRLAVAGSAGGNMATVVAMMAKKEKKPTIKLQVLFWPLPT